MPRITKCRILCQCNSGFCVADRLMKISLFNRLSTSYVEAHVGSRAAEGRRTAEGSSIMSEV
ncbi:hypothetical protein PILCRDRAFT_824300 [Piloderma croceum F 1598]|uniref:Uncharacterized protein n=1 Tax=Piloderma croceum (strain F 1598) TaxID=765440 RepID=A0A0C3AWM7_PILCF|nr:hypothetical protein PILCRDRAFT_824300 [Piloderma croceum F 1598]